MKSTTPIIFAVMIGLLIRMSLSRPLAFEASDGKKVVSNEDRVEPPRQSLREASGGSGSSTEVSSDRPKDWLIRKDVPDEAHSDEDQIEIEVSDFAKSDNGLIYDPDSGEYDEDDKIVG